MEIIVLLLDKYPHEWLSFPVKCVYIVNELELILINKKQKLMCSIHLRFLLDCGRP